MNKTTYILIKYCDNSNRKIHRSNKFIFSISLLIKLDTLLLRPSLHCNTPLHFTALHPTILHNTYRRFTSSHLHSTTLSFGFTRLYFLSFHTSHHITSLHITSLHFTSLHFTSHHITSHHITSHHITSHHYTQYRSHPKNYFQKSKPLPSPKKLLTISLHFTFHFILFICLLLILSTLHFTLLCYS
jgi:hypothetical protein